MLHNHKGKSKAEKPECNSAVYVRYLAVIHIQGRDIRTEKEGD